MNFPVIMQLLNVSLILKLLCVDEPGNKIASSPGHSQILSRSHGEKLGEVLGSKLRHRLEMVDSVSRNRLHVTY